MSYWLFGLLVASNAALAFYFLRAARLSHSLDEARARNRDLRSKAQELKTRLRDMNDAGRDPEMMAALKASPVASLAAFARRKMVKDVENENHLPPLDCDLSALKAPVSASPSYDKGAPRSDLANHKLRLRQEFRGAPELCYLNALCIAYLRRRSPHTRYARTLFLRLWREEGAFLAKESTTRWLLSTLTTFMDHGETPAQRLIGATGAIFGNTVKIYEWERVADGLSPSEPYRVRKLPGDLQAMPGIGRISIHGGDIARNTLARATRIALCDGVAGPVLLALLVRLQAGKTVFTRLDEAKLRRAADASTDVGAPLHWSFGAHPHQFPE